MQIVIDRQRISEIVSLRAALFSLLLVLAGIGFLFLSANCEGWHWPICESVFREAGAFCLVTFILALWWEVIGRRSFTDELLSKIGMARDLELAGITTVAMDFRDSRIDWKDMFSSSSRLDVWIAYGSTWRNYHLAEIEEFLRQEGNLLQIAVPDLNDTRILQTLAERFSEDPARLQAKIQETIREFRGLANGPGKVRIYLAKSVPLFTFYRFSNSAVIAFYNHRKGRLSVPTLVCRKEGTLYQYIGEEFAFLASGEPLAPETAV